MRISLKEVLIPILLAAFVAATSPALAEDAPCPQDQEQEQEPTLGETLNGGFGKYVVNPVFIVMFVDVMFWDNKLPRSTDKAKAKGTITVSGKALDEQGDEPGWKPVTFQADVIEYDGTHFVVQKRIEALASAVDIVPDELHDGLDAPDEEEGTDGEEGDGEEDTVDSVPPPAPMPIQVGDRVMYEGAEYTVVEITESAELKTVASQEIAVPPGTDVERCYPIGSVQDGVEVIGHTTSAFVGRTVSRGPLAQVTKAQVGDPSVSVGSTVDYHGAKQELTSVGDMLALRANAPTTLESTDTIQYARPKNPKENNIPLVVLWLVLGAIFFTFRMGLINVRAFWHAIMVTAGRFDDPDDPGEVNHFKALSSALSATVGLGNIAGVALAVAAGGPGAVFWMIIAGFLGMSSKFVECTLAQMYRKIDEDGVVLGGPMRYLADGLKELKMAGLGKVLAVVFAIMCIGGSLGGGNMFQANQAFAQLQSNIPAFPSWLFGILIAVSVGMVIIGGIRRIGSAAGMIVPVMCGVYLLAGFGVLAANAAEIPGAFGTIVAEAFTLKAGIGALIGIIVTGFRRAAFSNEAGIGSAAIAHSAASTKEPVREGIVASLGPFIDTIVVCTMTGLVVVVTRAYLQDVGNGVVMTSAAFESVLPWFPYVLTFAVVMFAFSTMISWSYYGERCWVFLFGKGTSMIFRVIFVAAAFFGSIFSLGSVLDFSDLMVLGMAFPNILGVVLLSGKVKTLLDDYWQRYKSGTMKQTGSEPPAEPEAA